MGRHGSAIVGVVLGLVTAIGCSDDGGTVSQADAPEAVASEACAIYYECACDARDTDRFSSEEDCHLEVASDFQSDIDEGNAAGLTYHGECAADYIDAVDALGCVALAELLLDPDRLAQLDAVGQCKLFSGTRTAGQPCERLAGSNGDDCEPDLDCVDDVCVVPERQKGAGEACDEQDECAIGLVCLDIEGGDDSVCEDLPGEGETCKGTLDLCAVDFYCDQGSKTCRQLPGVGGACAPSPNYLQMRCGTGALCDDSDTCVEAPGGGESCAVLCQAGFACEDGVCVEQAPLACGLALSAG